MNVTDAFTKILNAQSVAEILKFLDEVCDDLGYVAWTFANTSSIPATEYDQEPFYLTTVKPKFDADYNSNNCARWDPVAYQAVATHTAFDWSDLNEWSEARARTSGRTRNGVAIMRMAFDHGYEDGTVIPAHTVDGRGRPVDTLITLFRERQKDAFDIDPHLARWLLPLIQAASARICELSPAIEGRAGPTARLTDREAEVLRWAARGKTMQETAEILSINRRTVEKTLENAMNKLGAANKAHAVAMALLQGLIAL
jgi:DNA-binding CsgD family transcriptional regulator